MDMDIPTPPDMTLVPPSSQHEYFDDIAQLAAANVTATRTLSSFN